MGTHIDAKMAYCEKWEDILQDSGFYGKNPKDFFSRYKKIKKENAELKMFFNYLKRCKIVERFLQEQAENAKKIRIVELGMPEVLENRVILFLQEKFPDKNRETYTVSDFNISIKEFKAIEGVDILSQIEDVFAEQGILFPQYKKQFEFI
jgi:hypothetical protein